MNVLEISKTEQYRRAVLEEQALLRKGRWYCTWRRIQDVVLSLVALVVLFPFMVLVAIIICIDSPGASPIFAQTRIGQNGKEFKCYKFRSMCPDAEKKLAELLKYNEMNGPTFKMKNDPRITKVGRFIRKVSIDELPQLWNVLRGDMSIVGPRPCLPREAEQYDDYAKQRLLVPQGLTCYWQIQPNRNQKTFEEWLELDIRYIKERSFWTDWKIILLTFIALLRMDGE